MYFVCYFTVNLTKKVKNDLKWRRKNLKNVNRKCKIKM